MISISSTQHIYAAFTRGLANKWTFLARTTQHTIRAATRFLPALTGMDTYNEDVRDLMALLVPMGELGNVHASKQATLHHSASEKITAPLTELILAQSQEYSLQFKTEQIRAKKISSIPAKTIRTNKSIRNFRKTPCNPSKIDEDFNGKGWALDTTLPRPWLRTPQECIPKCTLPTLWMATKTPFSLRLRPQIHRTMVSTAIVVASPL